jgi:2-furoyl-CoA dehydrogenase large subunit
VFSPESLAAPDAQDRVNTSAAYGFVFDLCGVEIDRDTGRVRIDRYVTAHDAGRLLNPALVDGQIRGAFAQGVGAALYEEFHYGADGSFLSGTLADYAVPTSVEIPDPVIVHRETPSPFTPLGAKGVGEGNNMSTPPAIANALADALRPLRGETDIVLPMTPARVLATLALVEPEPPAPAALAARHAAAPARADGVALRARGQVEIAASPERVFAVLLDPVALARVIPGCHALERDGPDRYRADVTIGIGLVKARYAARIAMSDIDPPRSLRLAGNGSATLGTGSGDGHLRLEPTAGGTLLHYDYEARVSGKVAAVGSRMLEGATRVLLAQLFEALGRQAAGAPQLTFWQRLLRALGLGSAR